MVLLDPGRLRNARVERGAVTVELVQAASHDDLAAERIAFRRRVLEWRDQWSMEADARLRAVAAARVEHLAAEIKGLSHKDLALARTGYGSVKIVAEIIDAATKAAEKLLVEAGAALGAIAAHHLQIEAQAAAGTSTGGFDTGDLAEFGRSAAPIAVAAGLGLALPGIATTTSVALVGLVTPSTVSVPLLAVGIGGIAALGALGVLSFSDLREDQEQRLNDAVQGELEERLFAPSRERRESSLLARLEAGFATAAHDLTGIQ
jgi:hypothetical protein